MNYEQAIQAANEGHKVRRESWSKNKSITGKEGKIYKGESDKLFTAEGSDGTANDWEILPFEEKNVKAADKEDLLVNDVPEDLEGDTSGPSEPAEPKSSKDEDVEVEVKNSPAPKNEKGDNKESEAKDLKSKADTDSSKPKAGSGAK